MPKQLLAVFVTYADKTESQECALCARDTWHQPTNDALVEYLEEMTTTATEGQNTVIDFAYEEYDEVCAGDEEKVFNEWCDTCDTPLGPWWICRFCGVTEWINAGHSCSEMPIEEGHPLYPLWEACQNGLADDFTTDESKVMHYDPSEVE